MQQIPLLSRRGGYALLGQMLKSDELNEIEKKLYELQDYGESFLLKEKPEWPESSGNPIVVAERSNPTKVCRIEYLVGSCDMFSGLVKKKLRPAAEAASGEAVVLFKDKCNFKLSFSGAFPPHQDITAYKHFGSDYQITVAISIDESNHENGCLEFAPNYIEELSLETSRIDQRTGVELPSYNSGLRNGDIPDEYSSMLTWIEVPTQKGDVLIFDSYIPHRSGVNNTESTRRMLFFTFTLASDGDYYSKYYHKKINTPDDPIFHVSTPTVHSRLEGKKVETVTCNSVKKQSRLFTPGPLNTSDSVRQAASRDIGSRTTESEKLTETIIEQLLELYELKKENNCTAVLMQGSGTFAIEATLTSFLDHDDHLIILNNGIYASRIAEIAIIHGIPHTVLNYKNTESIPIDEQLSEVIKSIRGATHIAAVHFETGFGVLNDVEALTHIAQAHGLRLMIDAMSSYGALPIPWVEGCTAALIASSNKCLHGLPGIGIVICDEEQLMRPLQARTLSLDLKAQAEGFRVTKQWRYTPPTHALLGLNRALIEHKQQGGTKARKMKYQELSEMLIDFMDELDMVPLIDKSSRGPMITTFTPRAGLKCDIRKLSHTLENSGFVIYPGKYDKKDSFRVGCMGEISKKDLQLLSVKMRLALQEQGV